MSYSVRHEWAFFAPLHSSRFRPPLFHRKQWSRQTADGVMYYSSPPIQRSPLSRQYPFHYNYSIQRRTKSSAGDYEESEGENNGNGLYLDEETYLQAEDTLLRSDGSLNFNNERQEDEQGRRTADFSRKSSSSLSDPPVSKIKNKTYQSAVVGLFSPPPSYSYSGDGDDDTNNDNNQNKKLSNTQQQLSDEERLDRAVMDIESGKTTSTQQPMMDAETLHQQVFAEEQTYLEQSEEFRKSLSSLHTDDSESPMAKERREVIERYNEQVLGDLMKEIDEMEKMALSREEAMRLAEKNRASTLTDEATSQRTKDAVVCSKCGLRVTPDVIRRAETIEIARDGGGVQKSSGILCVACYGQQLRATEEAKVRLGVGSFEGPGHPSSARMFDGKNNSPRRKAGTEKYYKGKQRSNAGYDRQNGSNIQGIDTSSLFDTPKVYNNAEGKSNTTPEAPIETDRPTSNTAPSGGGRRLPPRRTSRKLGGMELVKRMQRRQSSSEFKGEDFDQEQKSHRTDRLFEAQKSERRAVATQRMERTSSKQFQLNPFEEEVEDDMRDPSSSSTSTEGDASNTNIYNAQSTEGNWVKVEDPSSKRMFYWNMETGEMRRTLD